MVGFGIHELLKKNRYYHKVGNVFYPFGFTRPMIRFLDGYYNNGNKLVGVEIGVQRGYHSLNMFTVLGSRLQKLYLIDPWSNYNELEKNHDWFHTLPVCKRMLQPYSERVVFCKGYSQDKSIVDSIADESVDFVYIDGNHDYEPTRSDILNYLPKVKKGGVLGGHDCTIGAPGVVRAVSEFEKESGYKVHGSAFDWWVVKE